MNIKNNCFKQDLNRINIRRVKEDSMKIITVNIHKGGTGKTTLSYNLADYLAQKSKVLVLDMDKSRNLTNLYFGLKNFDEKHSIVGLYNGLEVQPLLVKKNLDVIVGSTATKELKKELLNRRQREILFFKWIGQNISWLSSYDYVIIDTENAQDDLVENAVIASDLVVGVAQASDNSVIAINALKHYIQEINQDYEMADVKLAIVGNEIDTIRRANQSKASKEFLELMKDSAHYAGSIQHRECMNHPKTIFEQARENPRFAKQHQEFIQSLSDILERIKRLAVA
jgi:chromosome partitioning protein